MRGNMILESELSRKAQLRLKKLLSEEWLQGLGTMTKKEIYDTVVTAGLVYIVLTDAELSNDDWFFDLEGLSYPDYYPKKMWAAHKHAFSVSKKGTGHTNSSLDEDYSWLTERIFQSLDYEMFSFPREYNDAECQWAFLTYVTCFWTVDVY